PKKRLIMALPFRDRVVQWAIYRVINPLLDRQFIYDSYACRVGKGTHKAADRLQYWLRYLDRRYPKVYVLKLDISKYFYRVDHAVLKGILRKKIADRDLLWLLDTIIDGDGQKFGIPLGDHDFEFDRLADIGMPIGNLTSQLFANLYLNEADQYAKHQLRLKYYIRYMDEVYKVC
ncbi:MAG: reverse transcriptase domain-containing protein, partial [Desulfofundulus sp.]